MAAETTTDTIRVSAVIPAPPERVYAAWLDDAEHSAITHSAASVEPWVGGRHSAWGGSIRGTTLELQPNRRIVQSWWASDFPPGSEESRLEVLFEPVPGGTLVTINHTGLPNGRGHRYEDGWKDFYLDSMKQYFPAHPTAPPREESLATLGSVPAAAKRPAPRGPATAAAKRPAPRG
ncbi:MAG TPA: SRPBCC domain-containing protein, partial [Candidatus Eisenbacteria bacterium]